MNRYRWYASDLHIGNRDDYGSIHTMLRRAREEAMSLDLLGDIFELIWRPFDYIVSTAPHKQVVLDLMGTADVIPVRILCGNHDLHLDQYAGRLDPVRVVHSPIAENGMYLSHGWEFDLNIKTFHKIHWWLAMNCPRLMYCISQTPWAMKKDNTEQWGKYIDKIHAAFWNDLLLAKYRVGIMGHTHSPQEWHHPTLDVHMYDLGDFCDSFTCLIWEPKPRFEVIQ